MANCAHIEFLDKHTNVEIITGMFSCPWCVKETEPLKSMKERFKEIMPHYKAHSKDICNKKIKCEHCELEVGWNAYREALLKILEDK